MTIDSIIKTVIEYQREGEPATLVILNIGKVLMIYREGVRLFRDRESVDDPLGNGCQGSGEFPVDAQPLYRDGSYVQSFRAGYIQLHDSTAILVTPEAINAYPSARDGLKNTRRFFSLPLFGAPS